MPIRINHECRGTDQVSEPWMRTTVVGVLHAQFYWRSPGVAVPRPVSIDTALTNEADTDDVMLISPLQSALLQVDVRLHDSAPDKLDAGWKDVVEFSFLAGAQNLLSGWDSAPEDLEVPLNKGDPYRFRYAIADMDLARLTD
jgi:hypothetical protein